MLTLTIPHTASDRLEDLLSAKQRAWKAATNDRLFRALRKSGTLSGYIAVTQIKYRRPPARTEGWHVHLHVLFFMSQELENPSTEEFQGRVTAAWAGGLARSGVKLVLSAEHGSDIRRVKGNFGIGRYLSTNERFIPQRGLDGLPEVGTPNAGSLANHDARSLLPMDLFRDFLERRSRPREGGKNASARFMPRFFDLPKNGYVYFDGANYKVASEHAEPEKLRISKADYPWFEFQLAVRNKKKTVFSYSDSTSVLGTDLLWSQLRHLSRGFDESDVLDDSELQTYGAGTDSYLVDSLSWKQVLAHNDENRSRLLLAAAKGEKAFYKAAAQMGIVARDA